MDEPVTNEALGFGEAIPDPKPRRVCDVWGSAHKWDKVHDGYGFDRYALTAPDYWICVCGAEPEN
jgi:hypothetical protein